MDSICIPNRISTNGNGYAKHIDYTEEEGSVKRVFTDYDENRDGVLDYTEFQTLLQSIFHPHNLTELPEEKLKEFMNSLDSNHDGMIDLSEFKHAWSHCFKKVLNPVTALVIVDVQYDFIDGTLALRNCPARQDGADVVPVINKLLDKTKFDVVIYSMDWHPESHISFVNNVHKYPHNSTKSTGEFAVYDEVDFELSPPRKQVLWPAHCIQGSDGAKLNKDLKVVANAVNIYKGTKTDIDSYSAFYDNMKLSQTAMQEELQRRNVTDVYVCGLAYDICVAATSQDSVDLGYRTVLIDDACRGVTEEGISKAKIQLEKAGALIRNSNDVIKMVNKETYSFDLGLFAAQTMPQANKV